MRFRTAKPLISERRPDMTMLYRSTHRLSRAGAPMENLAHSASFQSLDKIAPSNPGIKQGGQVTVRGLGCPVRFRLITGQSGDALQALALVEGLQADIVMADTAYDSDAFRKAIAARKATAVIPNNPSRTALPRRVKSFAGNGGLLIGPITGRDARSTIIWQLFSASQARQTGDLHSSCEREALPQPSFQRFDLRNSATQ